MEDSRIKRITLWTNRTEKDFSTLEAMIDDDGDLLLEGYDEGETPQNFWGDEDYEYWWVIKKKHKSKILRLLVKEQFDTDSDLKKWLNEKGIPGKSLRTIDKDYKDTALLWLIKERFGSDGSFPRWLGRHHIPKKFWSWV
jgi:hypothetical protein